ncbi:Ribonucleoside-diphosphate reductase small chain 2 [Nakaseomyces bracarensis]|uniref:Ribonucleoside-diphosphate reductase small chain 2 n=1 Tax=Nakaseomyces bracarensis TaxID=273131 RepID=A0ABR4NTP8_9SACH
MNVTSEEHQKLFKKYEAERHHMKEAEKDEVLLMENKRRFVMFPIKFHEIWNAYKKVEAAFWTAEEIELAKDVQDFEKLTEGQKEYLGNFLAIFTWTDHATNKNIVEKFSAELQNPEGKSFYGFQIMMENIYDEIYSMMVDAFFHDVKNIPMFKQVCQQEEIKAKSAWSQRWVFDEDTLYAERLVASAAKEGIFGSGAFASLFWLTKEKNIMPGLQMAAEHICRDRGFYADFAVLLFAHLRAKPNQKIVEQIIVEAVEIEKAHYTNSLPVQKLGVPVEEINQYIEYMADKILTAFGNEKYYNSTNPFPFMENATTIGKTNFFEKKISDYQQATTTTNKPAESVASSDKIKFDSDF